ncbi:MAG: hypothetical protein ACI8ZX_001964 [Planctomycetota bacterium]|jgi:hypothetical protein
MKLFFKIISIIFHPIFMPVYLAFLIVAYVPNSFPELFGRKYNMHMIMVAILMIGFPLISLAIMRALDMIQSFTMKKVKERFIPMIAVATYYLWSYMMFRPDSKTAFESDPVLSNMILGCVVSIFLAFFFNSFYKISLHAIAAGGMLSVIMNIMPIASYDMKFILLGGIVVVGLVTSARLYLKEHTNKEVYMGFFAGYFAQFFAYQIWGNLMY